MLDQELINKKKELAIKWSLLIQPTNKWKIKESIKIDKYVDLACELKKMRNMKVVMTTIVDGEFDVLKG